MILTRMALSESALHQIEGLIREIESRRLDITDNYSDEWLRIGFSLADALGEAGRPYFHRVSQFSPKYVESKADIQFSHCLKSRNGRITIRTLFFIAKSYGIDISIRTLLKYKNG